MSWIESHTVIIRHRKLKELALGLRIKPVYAMGHLHALWHVALEQQEDGDLSKWSDSLIADAACFDGDAPRFVSLLQRHGWLDGRRLHDWMDYAGRYLESRYRRSQPEKLKAIEALHSKPGFSRALAGPPDRTHPPDPPTGPERTDPQRNTAGPVRSSPDVLDLGWKVKGEFYGKKIRELPSKYCRWALTHLSDIGPEYRRGCELVWKHHHGGREL